MTLAAQKCWQWSLTKTWKSWARNAAGLVAESLVSYENPVAHTRMLRMHGRHPLDISTPHSDPRWEQAVAAVKGYEENPELDLDLG